MEKKALFRISRIIETVFRFKGLRSILEPVQWP